jgi:hypothetical protein
MDMVKHPAFDEYTVVSLARSIDQHGVFMPKGARGVIMAAYGDGLGYEVEFDDPQHAVLTLEEKDLLVEQGVNG